MDRRSWPWPSRETRRRSGKGRIPSGSLRCLFYLFALVVLDVHAQSPGEFRHIADYSHVGLVLNTTVGPGPVPGTQRLYATLVGTSRFHLLEIDPESGRVEVFDSPLPGEIAAWGMVVGPDGNIYLGTAPNAHFMKLDVARSQLVDLGRASPSEGWLWSLTVGADGRIYGGTSPGCRLVWLDPRNNAIGDLGVIDPEQQYLRYVSGSSDGTIYMGIGDSPGDIASYNINSSVVRRLIPPSSREVGFAYVYQGSDGSTYGTLSPYAFRLTPSSATEIPWEEKGTPAETTTLSDGTSLSLSAQSGALMLTETARDGTMAAIPIAYSGEPTSLFRIAGGEDGLIYGSAAMPSDLVQIDPASGAERTVGSLGPGEAYSLAPSGGKVLLATYSDDPSTLAYYDPAQPFVNSGTISNPVFIPVPENDDSWRPFAMTVASDGTAYVGAEAGYGKTTGPLIIWNPNWESAERYEVVPGQSVVTLATSGKFVVGGTSTDSGLGAKPTTSTAQLFVWDRRSNQTASIIEPIPGASNMTDLVAENNGDILGIAGSSLFEVDPDSGTVLGTQSFPGADLIYNSAAIDKVGRVWVLAAEGVYVVDPSTRDIVRVAVPPAPVTCGFVFHEDRIYFCAGASVYAYRFPGTLPAQVELTTATASPPYGSGVTVNASVQSPSSALPTGTISVSVDGQTTMTTALVDGAASASLEALTLGTHTIVASYSGDSFFARAQSSPLVVGVRATARVVTTPSGYSAGAGDSIRFVSNVSSAQGLSPVPTGTVQLFADGVLLGIPETLEDGKAIVSADLTAGYHTLVASYSGDSRFRPTSSVPFTESVQGIKLSTNVSVAEIPLSGSESIPIAVTPEGGLEGSVSFLCSGAPTGVTCGFSAPRMEGGGVTQLILKDTSPAAASAVVRRSGRDRTELTFACFFLLLPVLSHRRGFRSGMLAAATMLGSVGCGTTRVPAEIGIFQIRVTALQVCGPASRGCFGVSTAIDIPATVKTAEN